MHKDLDRKAISLKKKPARAFFRKPEPVVAMTIVGVCRVFRNYLFDEVAG